MNVLGVTFDSKLNWGIHVAKTISKAKKALYALKMIKKFFTKNEMRKLLDSNFYSILYYNAVIWLTPNLKSDLKQDLLSASACALRSCLTRSEHEISFLRLHKIHMKCTPDQIMLYQQALQLHKTINHVDFPQSFEYITVVDQTICTSRQLRFQIFKNNRSKIGLNTTANKLYCITNLVSLEMLNMTFVHFKKLVKIQFKKNGKT